MKVFRKRIKPITVDNHLFLCVVDERSYDVAFRVYSGVHKTSFVEIFFDWKETYYINLYLPGVRASLIKYAITKGWNPLLDRQTIRISDSSSLIEELRLREYK